jgi:hypothetical protein
LPLEAGNFGQVFLTGGFDKLRHAHALELGDMRLALLVQGLEGLGGPFEIAAVGQFGQLFGQRKGLAFRLDLAKDFEVLGAELGGIGRRRVVAAVNRSIGCMVGMVCRLLIAIDAQIARAIAKVFERGHGGSLLVGARAARE